MRFIANLFTLSCLSAVALAVATLPEFDPSKHPACQLACITKYLDKVDCPDIPCTCAIEKDIAITPYIVPCLTSTCTSGEIGQAINANLEFCSKWNDAVDAGATREEPPSGAAAADVTNSAAKATGVAGSPTGAGGVMRISGWVWGGGMFALVVWGF